MDRVEEIAAAIASLPSAEKERLFRLLAERGEETGRGAGGVPGTATQPSQPSASRSSRSPDYLLVFDGGSKGNPGWGYGSYAITRLQDGAQRLERLDLGKDYTNNEAEYDTLIAALQDLIKRIEDAGRQPQEFGLEIRGDSMLVIRQLQGKWQAKEPRMAARRDRCLALLKRFGGVELKTQPREESVRILGH
jgi:ribonuclease HI